MRYSCLNGINRNYGKILFVTEKLTGAGFSDSLEIVDGLQHACVSKT